MDAGHFAHAVDRLGVTARVLYVAAHPDDENTRLLGYLANARHVTVAYLSMTRGGGGQNLIGREQAELLDVDPHRGAARGAPHRRGAAAVHADARLRLLEARQGDARRSGATTRRWPTWSGSCARFSPDVIITRFDEKPPNHGHHTASAILAREAFAAAADPQRFPEQLTRWRQDLAGDAARLQRAQLPRRAAARGRARRSTSARYDARSGRPTASSRRSRAASTRARDSACPGERGIDHRALRDLAGAAGERRSARRRPARGGSDSATAGATAAPRDRRCALKRRRATSPRRALPALLAAAGRRSTRSRTRRACADARGVRRARSPRRAGLFVRATSPRPAVVARADGRGRRRGRPAASRRT